MTLSDKVEEGKRFETDSFIPTEDVKESVKELKEALLLIVETAIDTAFGDKLR